MYQQPQKPPPWWLETLALTRVVLGVLFWPLAVLLLAIIGIVALVIAFSTHWLLGLLVLAIIVGAIALFARWDRGRSPRIEP